MESPVIGCQKMVLSISKVMGDGEGLYKQCLGREEKGVEMSALNLPKTQTFNEQKNE